MAFIEFENITQQANISDVGESWGTAFGDFNGDGWVDLWLNNHLAVPKLYINQKDGTFVDTFRATVDRLPREDNHGAAWADFDNDGDQDLIQLNGAGGGQSEVPNFLFVNEGGRLIERAAEFNLDYPKGRGRMPLWLDQNRDGRLDLFVGVADRPDQKAPPTLFQQTSNRFNDVGQRLGITQKDGTFAQFSYLTGKVYPELALIGKERVIFDVRPRELTPITSELGLNNLKGTDFVIADLNNDLRPDLFQTRFQTKSDLFQDTSQSFKAYFQNQGTDTLEKGVEFQTFGTLDIEIPTFNPRQIFIGAQGLNPDSVTFTLNPDDPNNEGLKPSQGGENAGLYIGFNPSDNRWEMRWVSGGKSQIFAQVKSQQAIEALTPINFNPTVGFNTDLLWLNTPNGFQQQIAAKNVFTAAQSVTAGDFDNDMDLDLYVVSATKVGNPNNIFYENQGDGTFKTSQNSATGTSLGVGSAAASADINNDGFLDLLVTNGGSFLGNGRSILDDGPTELFLNQGNQNHWLAVDLEGRDSNRDGIGSQVFVTAGGLTQLREYNGGTQSQVQNHARLHFGLGQNSVVDQVVVKWTNGLSQTLSNVNSRQFLTIVEGMGERGDDIIIGTVKKEILRGLGGNDEIRGGGGNDTLVGHAGEDQLIGNAGDDSLRGGDDADTLIGSEGNDILKGQAGDDRLLGGEGQDLLLGDIGDDWLLGEGGQDSLRGGDGADSFQLNALRQGAVTLQDFISGMDRIVIERAEYGMIAPRGMLTDGQLIFGSSASHEDHRLIYDPNRGRLLFDGDGNGDRNPVLIAKLGKGTPLRASDIHII